MKTKITLHILMIALCCTIVSCEKKTDTADEKYVGSWNFSYALIDNTRYNRTEFLKYLESPSQASTQMQKELTTLVNTSFTLNSNTTFKGYMPTEQPGVLFSPTGTWSVSNKQMFLNDPDKKLEWIYNISSDNKLYQSFKYYSRQFNLYYSK